MVCSDFGLSKTSHGVRLGHWPFSLSSAERQWGNSQAAFSLGEQTRPASQSLANPPYGAWKGESTLRSAKQHLVRRAALLLALGEHPGLAAASYPLLAARGCAFLLLLLSAVCHGGRETAIRCSFQGGPHPWWALGLLTAQGAIYAPLQGGAPCLGTHGPWGSKHCLASGLKTLCQHS